MDFVKIIIELAQQSKYPLLFVVFLIEGPITGFISSFIATTGALNIYIIFLMFITAEIGADVFYYYFGKGLSESRLNIELKKYEERGFLNTIKTVLSKNPVKALIFVKIVGVIAIPSIFLIGKYRSLKQGKFIIWTTVICLVKDLTITLMGYSLGLSLSNFLKIYDIYNIMALILGLLVIVFLLFITYKEKLEELSIKFMKKIK